MALKQVGSKFLSLKSSWTSFRRQLSAPSKLLQQDASPEEATPVRPEFWDADSLMDIGTGRVFNTDHDILRQSVRRFITEEIVPHAPRFEEQGHVDKEIWKKAGDRGYLCIKIPCEHGGHGGDVMSSFVITEEICRHNLSAPQFGIQNDIIPPYISRYGTDAQRKKYIPQFTAGNWITAIGWTEPNAGSDMQGFKTYARKDGDDYILNGSKVFITHGWVGDIIMVAAVTKSDAQSVAHGMSLFLVHDGMPGFNKGRKLKKIGFKSMDTAELFFDDVRLSKEHLLGEENHGFKYMMTNLGVERLDAACMSLGYSEFMFEETRRYVKERTAFGSRLADKQVIQHKLAEMKTDLVIGRTFYEQCVLAEHEVGISAEAAAMAKYWLSDLQHRVAAECLQLHGGWGYMQEFPISSAYTKAPAQRIFGGSNEIMKNLIARPIIR